MGLDLEHRSICTKLMTYLQILADFKGKIEWAISFIWSLCYVSIRFAHDNSVIAK